MSCLHWTLSFTRTSLPLRSVRQTRHISCLHLDDLYSFIYFQRYDGDVGDLGLTLSYDEDVMGQVRTEWMNEWINTVANKQFILSTLCSYTACLPRADTGRENDASHKWKQVKYADFRPVSTPLIFALPSLRISVHLFLQDQLHPPHGSLPDAHAN